MTEPQPLPSLPTSIIQAIDLMIERVNRFKADPRFSEQMCERSRTTPRFAMNDREILRLLVVLIAYSRGAKSKLVERLVEGDVFESIFQKYIVRYWEQLSAKDGNGDDRASELAQTILDEHWPDLTAIRFRGKIKDWTCCPKYLVEIQHEYGSFMAYLKHAGFPIRIESERDLRVFWSSFDKVEKKLSQMKFPYIGQLTSLCHLLLGLGFDCAKPDSAVMKSAVELGIVPEPSRRRNKPNESGSHPKASLKKAVRTMQAYAVQKGMRVPVIDLYFLIHGGQTSSVDLVKREYYDKRRQASSEYLCR